MGSPSAKPLPAQPVLVLVRNCLQSSDGRPHIRFIESLVAQFEDLAVVGKTLEQAPLPSSSNDSEIRNTKAHRFGEQLRLRIQMLALLVKSIKQCGDNVPTARLLKSLFQLLNLNTIHNGDNQELFDFILDVINVMEPKILQEKPRVRQAHL